LTQVESNGYDEPGSRTRFAWLRTSLVFLAVNALALRGLFLRDGPVWLYAVIGLECAAFMVVAGLRIARLGPWASPGVPRHLVFVTSGCAIGCSIFAAMAINLISP
jgi:hypothetical protein